MKQTANPSTTQTFSPLARTWAAALVVPAITHTKGQSITAEPVRNNEAALPPHTDSSGLTTVALGLAILGAVRFRMSRMRNELADFRKNFELRSADSDRLMKEHDALLAIASQDSALWEEFSGRLRHVRRCIHNYNRSMTGVLIQIGSMDLLKTFAFPKSLSHCVAFVGQQGAKDPNSIRSLPDQVQHISVLHQELRADMEKARLH